MLPTISARGDGVLISKSHRRGRGVKVGDLVDFEHPLVPGVRAIKRVLGMPGDFVEVGDWQGGGRSVGQENMEGAMMIQVRWHWSFAFGCKCTIQWFEASVG